MKNFIMKRNENYWWELTLVKIGKPLVLLLVATPITPNMVTLFNLIVIFPIICFLSWFKLPCLLAIFIQVYAFLDVIDGNLARNKNMKSEFGRKLDYISDTLFYTLGVFFIGFFCCEVPIWNVILLIVIHQVYGVIATYYIVPNIKRKDVFIHTKLKSFFMNKGIIFGMDATLECFIMSVCLFFPFRRIIFLICPLLWSVDMIYRIYELKIVNRTFHNYLEK